MPQFCLNLSNILYLFSYGVRDVLLLRILSVFAMLVAMPYYFWHASEPALVPISWNIAFMLINSGWVVRIILERLPPRFTPEQRKLYEYAFHKSCTPRQMLQLLEKAEWREAESGQLLARRGRLTEELIILHSGQASAQIRGREVARLRDGDLVGEMSFLTNEPMSVDVFADGPLKYVAWNTAALHDLFERRLDLKVAIQGMIGQNLVGRLTHSMGSVPEFSLNLTDGDLS